MAGWGRNFRHTDTQKNNVRQPMAVADKGDTGMAKGSAARMIWRRAMKPDTFRNPAESGLREG